MYRGIQQGNTHTLHPMYNIRMCAGSLLNSISSSCGGIGLVWIGPCGGFPNFIFIFLFFFPAPSQTRRYLRSYRGKREEEKEGEKGGGGEKKRRAQECAQFFKLDNPSVRTWFDTCFFIYSFLFYFGLHFLFFSLSAHTDREREKKVRKPGPDHAYTRTRKSCWPADIPAAKHVEVCTTAELFSV